MRKNSGSGRVRFLSQEDLDIAIGEVVEAAKQERVSVALAGGAAMQFYGSDRLTADLDFISSATLMALPRGKALSFGGEQTRAPNGVPVDLIVRDDVWTALYEDALNNAIRVRGCKAPVVRAEHLLSMKIAAGRNKDMMDVEFLMASVKLNKRDSVHIAEGFLGALGAQDVEALFLERRLTTGKRRKR